MVAKAREATTREYAVQALRELVVDGVERLHPLPTNAAQGAASASLPSPPPPLPPPPPPALASRSSSTSSTNAAVSSGPSMRAVPAAAPTSRSGATSTGSEEGFIATLVGLRGRSEGVGQGEERPFRWSFDGDVSGVFVPGVRPARDGIMDSAGGGEFEAVLFETMGLFALTPHVDTREVTLQTLYTILQVTVTLLCTFLQEQISRFVVI